MSAKLLLSHCSSVIIGSCNIRDDLMLFLWLVDDFMHLAADGIGFKFTEQLVYCLFSRMPTIVF